MRFFAIAFFLLFLIGAMNLIEAIVGLNIRDGVYACSEVVKTDPLQVQKKCRKV